MTYPAYIRKKILAKLEVTPIANWLPDTASVPTPSLPGKNSHNPKVAVVLRHAFSQKKSSGKTWLSTLMTINGKGLHVWAARRTASARRSSAIASPLKKDFHHRKADEERHREFLEVKSIYEERLHPFVYIDESSFRKDISRPYGYAPRGQKCAGVSGWSKAQINVIGALCGTVPFAFTAFDCSIDSDVFHTWVTKILLPELPACSVIVMDNASFHKRQDTLDALQAEGHTVLWLPPYSPDFNPIEKTWAWIKRLRKQWRLADVNALLFWFFTLVTLY